MIDKELKEKIETARESSRILGRITTADKNNVIRNIADLLVESKKEIIAANSIDYSNAKKNGMSDVMLDRLMLDEERIEGIAKDAYSVAQLPDPVGEKFDSKEMENGLKISKQRVPLGVIATIYESRPNVTVDIAVLAIKSGNSVVLRGGKEAINSNKALMSVIERSIESASLPTGCVSLIESTDRKIVSDMLSYQGGIDLLIPRGGADLIKFVRENALIPVVTGGIGVCHIYVDETADVKKSVKIINNAKVQRPTVCNALDTILLHASIAPAILDAIQDVWIDDNEVEVHADDRAMALIGPSSKMKTKKATSDDWGREFLSLIAAIKIVDSMDEALQHIGLYGEHSESILTNNPQNATRFLNEVDSAAVYVNASTRFTDGAQFGLGAEVAISTNKLHARGPMGLEELTSYKWVIVGDWHVRD